MGLCCKKRVPLRKFCSQNSSPAKRGFLYEIISQPKVPSAKLRSCCEIGPPLRNHFSALRPPSTKFFAAAKPLSGTRVPFRSPNTHFATAKRAMKPSKVSFRSPSTLYETLPWHTSAISQPTLRFHTCEMACKISPRLRNRPHAAK